MLVKCGVAMLMDIQPRMVERRIAGGFVNEETKRRPMIIPIVSLAK